MRTGRFLALLAMCTLPVSSVQALTVYSNDFSSNANGFTGANAIQTSPDGTTFLGFLAQGADATLTLNGLAPHSTVTLNFDMYALESLDGDNSHGFGPDFFTVTSDGSTVLLNDTFSSGWAGGGTPNQSYGGPGLSGSYPATTGAASYDPTAFGFGCYYGCENTYALSFLLNDTSSSISFDFIGNTTQAWPDEAFGIDNVVVTTDATDAPEPLTLSLFGAGLASAVMLRRRARRST